MDTEVRATRITDMQKRRPARGPEPASANADLSRMRTVRTSRYAHDRGGRHTSFDVSRETHASRALDPLGGQGRGRGRERNRRTRARSARRDWTRPCPFLRSDRDATEGALAVDTVTEPTAFLGVAAPVPGLCTVR
jgi:hypothetical protein